MLGNPILSHAFNDSIGKREDFKIREESFVLICDKFADLKKELRE